MESVAIWKRAPVAFAIVLVLLGAAAGFGVGYSVGDSGGKSTVKVAKVPPRKVAPQKQTPAQARLNRIVACMSESGVRWPKRPGGPQLKKAPPGVNVKTYQIALGACYYAESKANAKTKVPATSP